MKKTPTTLEKQLADVEKASKAKEVEVNFLANRAAVLRKEIEAINKANQPKPITERVKNFSDVLKIAKPDKELLSIINYSGKNKIILFSKYMAKLALISQVLNEGHEFKMDSSEHRYYPYFGVSSGFVFDIATYGDACASTASASRLCFKTRALAEYAGKIFLEEHKAAFTV